VPDLAGSMHEFPRGAEAGTLLHTILEEADLAMPDRAALRRAAEAVLDRAGFDRSHVDRVVHVVESVARTPLPGTRDARCLGDIPADQRRPEIGFTLAALPGGGRAGLSPAGLADLLATAPEKSPLHAYAERAALLDWRTLQGFLRGFIDSVFCDGERYFLIDYKSNHLGVRRQDYMPDALVRPMIEHDYVLQYLVYAVALDRHLATRIEGYDYERHFGGIYYLFLRGLARAHPPGCGIFFDRPPADLIQRISALIGEPDAAGGGA
jgi:exodeoxyribonuclease V beta subunit